jgi:hypothetical protein
MSGLFILVSLISVFRVGYLLLHPDKPRHGLIRPTTAVVICALILSYINLSLAHVRHFAEETASEIQAECNEQRRCPQRIEGWTRRGDRYSSQTKYGRWVEWPILYHTDGQQFEVLLYKTFDLGERWTGGVAKPLAKRDVN